MSLHLSALAVLGASAPLGHRPPAVIRPSRCCDFGVQAMVGTTLYESDRPASFSILTTEPWLKVNPSTGTLPPGGEPLRVELQVKTVGLAPDQGYRGAVQVESLPALGHDPLEVVFRTVAGNSALTPAPKLEQDWYDWYQRTTELSDE